MLQFVICYSAQVKECIFLQALTYRIHIAICRYNSILDPYRSVCNSRHYCHIENVLFRLSEPLNGMCA